MKMSEKRHRVSRRQFLNYTLTGVGGFMAAGMLMPMVRFALDPVLRPTEDQDMVQVVSVDELTNEPQRFDFKIKQVDAWYESEESRSAWVFKSGDEIVALSPVCKHLGCTVNWNSDPKNPNKFFCPCHYGLYEKDGTNVPGTPPLDITPLWRDIADHEVPEHVNPAHHFSAFVYCFGGLTFFVTVIQVLSGMFLTMYYVPDIKNAWESVYYLQNEVAFGQIVRGMHHWGASLVIVMMFLHTLRVFFQGAYKKPRELNWIVGVLIFFVMLGLGFTGYLLPWDMKALFATKVGLQIAEATPLIGSEIKTLLAGHPDIVGAQTLTRFFAIHVFFLPAALFGLMAAHFIMIRKQGISGPL